MEFIIENGILRRIIPEKGETVANVPEGVTELCDVKQVYEENKQIKQIIFADGLHTITGRAFRGFTNLESIILPVSLKEIWYENGCGPFIWGDCPSLRYVRFLAKPEKEWIEGSPNAFAYLEEGPEVFTPKQRTNMISGFIEAVADNIPMEDSVRTAYENYIKSHAAKYAEKVYNNPTAYRYLLENKLIKQKEIDGLIENVKFYRQFSKSCISDLPQGEYYRRIVKYNDDIIKQLKAYKVKE